VLYNFTVWSMEDDAFVHKFLSKPRDSQSCKIHCRLNHIPSSILLFWPFRFVFVFVIFCLNFFFFFTKKMLNHHSSKWVHGRSKGRAIKDRNWKCSKKKWTLILSFTVSITNYNKLINLIPLIGNQNKKLPSKHGSVYKT